VVGVGVGPGDLEVRGGAGGVAATYAGMRGLADAHDALGDRLRARGRAVLGLAGDGDLLASAALAPATFARAEAALVASVWGGDGLVADAVRWEADALAVRATATGLDVTDAVAAAGVGVLAHHVGRAAAPVLVAVAPTVAAGLAVGHLTGLTERLGALPALQGAVVGRPGLVEPLVVTLAGSVDALTGRAPPLGPGLLGPGLLVAPSTPDPVGSAGVLAAPYGPDRPPRVARRSDLDGPVAPPRGVGDLLDDLGAVAARSDDADGSGTVAVDTLVGADGGRRHVVHLPGTDDMRTPPWGQDGDVRDLGTNLRLMAREPTAYGAGVLEAMRQAGVRPGEPVLLTGHSQGGMQAVALAADDSPYDVRQVVTAGSPTAQVPTLDDDVSVLALENRGDVVPLLDGAPNPDTPHRVTVTFDAPVADGDVADLGERHRLGHYREAGDAVDGSADPSLVAQREQMRELGFLDAETAERRAFRVTR